MANWFSTYTCLLWLYVTVFNTFPKLRCKLQAQMIKTGYVNKIGNSVWFCLMQHVIHEGKHQNSCVNENISNSRLQHVIVNKSLKVFDESQSWAENEIPKKTIQQSSSKHFGVQKEKRLLVTSGDLSYCEKKNKTFFKNLFQLTTSCEFK